MQICQATDHQKKKLKKEWIIKRPQQKKQQHWVRGIEKSFAPFKFLGEKTKSWIFSKYPGEEFKNVRIKCWGILAILITVNLIMFIF